VLVLLHHCLIQYPQHLKALGMLLTLQYYCAAATMHAAVLVLLHCLEQYLSTGKQGR
jgi:hypothetical protein